MAVAGSMTTAYRLSMRGGTMPHVDKTTFLSTNCTPPAVAAQRLREWNADSVPVVVMGSDMAQFWQLWGGVN